MDGEVFTVDINHHLLSYLIWPQKGTILPVKYLMLAVSYTFSKSSLLHLFCFSILCINNNLLKIK